MSLSRATRPDGTPVRLEGDPPYSGDALLALLGVPFDLPSDDPFVHGAGDAAHAYLDGARAAWSESPDWMDFLDEDSPIFDLKQAERDIYLHWWGPWLAEGGRALDVGCGIGRFTTALLDRGYDVHGVDADIDSLRRCAWHAAGREGRLDLHWAGVHHLPDVEPVDLVVAAEVLCYVPDVDDALAGIVQRMKPGAALLLSMEARWGWASSPDAPRDALDEALEGTGVLDLPGDRWVRTFTREELCALLERAGLRVERIVATHYVTDGPLEAVMPSSATLEELLAAEARCRAHPVWRPLNRIWTAVARR